jgi:hypothetical protein
LDKIHGSQYDIELGYALLFKNSRLSAEYFSVSEDFNQLFPTAHKWLGYAGLFKRQNIKGFAGRCGNIRKLKN